MVRTLALCISALLLLPLGGPASSCPPPRGRSSPRRSIKRRVHHLAQRPDGGFDRTRASPPSLPLPCSVNRQARPGAGDDLETARYARGLPSRTAHLQQDRSALRHGGGGQRPRRPVDGRRTSPRWTRRASSSRSTSSNEGEGLKPVTSSTARLGMAGNGALTGTSSASRSRLEASATPAPVRTIRHLPRRQLPASDAEQQRDQQRVVGEETRRFIRTLPSGNHHLARARGNTMKPPSFFAPDSLLVSLLFCSAAGS